MAVKVLVTELGAHVVADTKQVENSETKEVIAYWVKNPRLCAYSRGETGDINVSFTPYCLVSDESEFSIRASHVVSILEPRDDVTERYNNIVNPPVEGEVPTTTLNEVTDVPEPNADLAEVG